jgi:hypothetical protein
MGWLPTPPQNAGKTYQTEALQIEPHIQEESHSRNRQIVGSRIHRNCRRKKMDKPHGSLGE